MRKFLYLVLSLYLLAGCTNKESTIEVSSVSLNTATIEMVEGETFNLVATVLPKDAEYDGVTWASSDASVASVNSGTVTAVKEGTATITASAGGKSATCTVTVSTKVVAVTSIALDKTSLSMQVGETETITATVSPDNATDKSVTWGSSDVSVATVFDGIITAKKSGEATISAKSGPCIAKCKVTIIVSAESITLDKTIFSLAVGETVQLTATVKPDDATDKKVVWNSSDETVATVDDGKVTAVKSGKATITAKCGGKTAECAVTVAVPTSSVTLDKTTLSLAVGETAQLTATVKPDDATDKNVSWTSSDETVAKVDNGKVTAVKAGKAMITAKCSGKTAECAVIVTIPVTGVYLEMTSLSLAKGENAQLSAVVTPTDASNKNIVWTSNNPNVATVSQSGLVRAIGGGKTIISVQTEDGGYKSQCAVTVSINVTGVTISKTSLSMIQGDTYTLSASVHPSDATNKELLWSSDDHSIATVTSSGMVTAIGGGNTKITVKSSDGGYQDYCNLSVVADSHQAVDLGLSVKWAKFNYKTSSSTEIGGYYLWGDPTGTAVIMEYSAPSRIDISGTDYDIVRKGWGGNWRLPTKSEVSELYNKCKWETATLNGVVGFKVIGPNGNSIFMPVTGYAYPADGHIGRTKTTDTNSLYIMTGQSYFAYDTHMVYVFRLKSDLSYGLIGWNTDFAKFPVRGVR